MKVLKQTVEDKIIKNVLNSKLPFHKLRNKKILVTGCNGFVSSSFIYYLYKVMKKKKYRIYFYGIRRNKRNNYLKKLEKNKIIKVFKVDLNKKINLKIKPDILLHAASITSPVEYSKKPTEVLLTNAIGTINLLNFSIKQKINKFLLLSSGEVYGDMRFSKKHIFDENSLGDLNPSKLSSNYGISKKFAENALISWSNKYNIFTNSVRLFHTYGPEMKLNDGRIHSDLVHNILRNKNLIIKGDGKTKRSFCYISDAITGILTVILKGKKNEIYNVSNPSQMLSVKDLAKTILKYSKIKKLKIKIMKNSKKRNNFFYKKPSIKKLKLLGWTPKITCKEGFAETIKYFKN